MTYYRRKLPHWHPEAAVIFLTWRLHGSTPSLGRFREPAVWGADERQYGRDFVRADRLLDRCTHGPLWLRDRRIAKMSAGAFLYAEEQLDQYILHAYVIMANHIHLLIEPKVELARITRTLKGFTARRANEILGRTGTPFWRRESYDRWVRSPQEYRRIVHYIEWNPVKAGLVTAPQEYEWSSARWRTQLRQRPTEAQR